MNGIAEKIKLMTPQQKAEMAQIIQTELASRQAGGTATDTMDMTSMAAPAKPRGFLPVAASAVENLPNALSIAIRGKPIKDEMIEPEKKAGYKPTTREEAIEFEKEKFAAKGGAEKPIYTLDDEGNLVQVGSVPGKSVVKTMPPSEKDVYTIDPQTGEMRSSGKVNRRSQVVTSPVPTAEKITMASNIETMDTLLTDMEKYLQKKPEALATSKIPFMEREFKAIIDLFDKTAAIAAGGKQLTETELALIRSNRPTLQDIADPNAMAYKFKILRQTLNGARQRMGEGGGQVGEQDDEYSQYLQTIGQ